MGGGQDNVQAGSCDRLFLCPVLVVLALLALLGLVRWVFVEHK